MADAADEWTKLPTLDKVEHKVWRARVSGYEEATKLLATADENSPHFMTYTHLLKKFLSDSNVTAQEKGCQTVLTFLETAPLKASERSCADVIPVCIAKCLSSTKQGTKTAGIDIILKYCELEKVVLIQEELVKAMETVKNPKHVIMVAKATTTCLTAFGNKAFPVKPLVKVTMTRLLEDRDKGVRDEGKALVLEMFRWVGEALRPQITNSIKSPVLLSEIEAELANVDISKPPRPVRYLFSQKPAEVPDEPVETSEGVTTEPTTTTDDVVEAPVDPWEFADPEDILSKIPESFYEVMLEDKDKDGAKRKWTERRDALTPVCDMCQKIRLAPGQGNNAYGELVRCLRKIVDKEPNINLVELAVKCLGGLAAGLRKAFSREALSTLESLLGKCKEKRPALVAALRTSLDSVGASVTNYDITFLELILPFVANKSPNIKQEALQFLTRLILTQPAKTFAKKSLVKAITADVIKGPCDDQAGSVREAAFELLAALSRAVGDTIVTPFLADMDKIKAARIAEIAPTLTPKFAAPAVSASVTSVSISTASAVSARPVAARPATAPAKTKPTEKPNLTARPKTSGKVVKGGGSGKAKTNGVKKASSSSSNTEADISEDTARDICCTLFGDAVVQGLSDAAWKARKEACDEILQAMRGMVRADIKALAICKLITNAGPKSTTGAVAHRVLKETNFQVLKLKVDIAQFLATETRFTTTSGDCVSAALAEKLADVKNGAACKSCLLDIASAVGVDRVVSQTLATCFAQRNPKVQKEALLFTSEAIRSFGLKAAGGAKQLLDYAKQGLAASMPDVRQASLSLLGLLSQYIGQDLLKQMFDGEKPALVALIDEELQKCAGEPAPVPTRRVLTGDDDDSTAGDVENMEAEEEELDNLVERTNVREQVTNDAMIERLNDPKNWKVRKEGLDEVGRILAENKFIEDGGVSDLLPSLLARLKEANKPLVCQTLTILKQLAEALPKKAAHSLLKTVGPAIIQCCFGDGKPLIRTPAVVTLDTWVDKAGGNAGLISLLSTDCFSTSLNEKANPTQKTEVLKWFTLKLSSYFKLPDGPGPSKTALQAIPKDDLLLVLPIVLALMEDRSADVRKCAQEAILPLMMRLSFDAMLRECGKLKPSSKSTVLPWLEKQRLLLPAAPPPKAASKGETAEELKKALKQSAGGPLKATNKTLSRTATVTKSKLARSTGNLAASSTQVSETNDDMSPTVSGRATPRSRPSTMAGRRTQSKPQLYSATTGAGDASESATALMTSEMKFKTSRGQERLRWHLQPGAIDPIMIETLKNQMMKGEVAKHLQDLMFSTDFKNHLLAIDALEGFFLSSGDDDERKKTALMANLDLILKWLTLRLLDTNPSVHIRGLTMLRSLLRMAIEGNERMSDYEANALLPVLLFKIGDPKDVIRQEIHAVLQQLGSIYPVNRIVQQLQASIRENKTQSKLKAESIDALKQFYLFYGECVHVSSAALVDTVKQLLQLIADRDNGVRSATLNALVCLNDLFPATVAKHSKDLKEKELSMLTERVRRNGKIKTLGNPDAAPANEATSRSGAAAPAKRATLANSARKSSVPQARMTNGAGTHRVARQSTVPLPTVDGPQMTAKSIDMAQAAEEETNSTLESVEDVVAAKPSLLPDWIREMGDLTVQGIDKAETNFELGKRLAACDPLEDSKSGVRRMSKVFHPLQLTHFEVDAWSASLEAAFIPLTNGEPAQESDDDAFRVLRNERRDFFAKRAIFAAQEIVFGIKNGLGDGSQESCDYYYLQGYKQNVNAIVRSLVKVIEREGNRLVAKNVQPGQGQPKANDDLLLAATALVMTLFDGHVNNSLPTELTPGVLSNLVLALLRQQAVLSLVLAKEASELNETGGAAIMNDDDGAAFRMQAKQVVLKGITQAFAKTLAFSKCPRTVSHLVAALINHLKTFVHECTSNDAADVSNEAGRKCVHLCMTALWRLTRDLGAERWLAIDARPVIRSAHDFLLCYPREFWKQQKLATQCYGDRPYKTLNTLLNNLVIHWSDEQRCNAEEELTVSNHHVLKCYQELPGYEHCCLYPWLKRAIQLQLEKSPDADRPKKSSKPTPTTVPTFTDTFGIGAAMALRHPQLIAACENAFSSITLPENGVGPSPQLAADEMATLQRQLMEKPVDEVYREFDRIVESSGAGRVLGGSVVEDLEEVYTNGNGLPDSVASNGVDGNVEVGLMDTTQSINDYMHRIQNRVQKMGVRP